MGIRTHFRSPGDAGGGGGSAGEGSDSGAGKGTGDFDRNALDPALRGMSAEEMNAAFKTLVQAVTSPKAPEPKKVEQPAAPTTEELRAMFDKDSPTFDPEKAVTLLANKNYGTLLGQLGERSLVGVYAKVEKEFPDFAKYSGKVEAALKDRDPSTIDEKVVATAYLTLKGADTVQAERAAAAKAAGTQEIAGGRKDDEALPPLDEVAQRVARKLFPDDPDPLKKYQELKARGDAGPVTVKVPVGRDADGKVKVV